MNETSAIAHHVMWNRLLAVVEEQAQTLVRAAFSTSAREAGDISAGIFDTAGRMLAQAVTGTPGHVNSMALAVGHFLERFPISGMQDGDCYITNDPWLGTGHLADFTVVSPTFRNGRPVALFAATTHIVDIGGIGQSPDGRQVYHEGLWVPRLPFMRAGKVNETFLEILRQNVREPVQVEGDVYALASCNETGGRRLLQMMDEFSIDHLSDIADFIIETTRNAMKKAINALPKATASHVMTIDGYDEPIELKAKLTIGDGEIVIDYDGSSTVSDYGINCPKCYTSAYSAFGVKCIVAPNLPNNAGALETIRIEAPANTIVNALSPCAVNSRNIIGQMLPDVVFGCLHQILPGRIPAEGASTLWAIKLGAGHGVTGRSSRRDFVPTPFTVESIHSGGTGARPMIDGLSATPFPSGVRNVPIEITEAITPLVIWRKEFRQDSGGPGRFRGGLGQTMVIGNREPAGFALFAAFDRTIFPAGGREGGCAGALGRVSLESGETLKSKGRQVIPEGERLVVEMPGGGGYGDPFERNVVSVIEDVRCGFVTRDAARTEYGVVLTEEFGLDEAATNRLRQVRRT